MSRLIVCILDGMADPPAPAGRRTPLTEADTPHLDTLARHSVAGLCHVIPQATPPGSEAGLAALLGCTDVTSPPRAPFEALAQGVHLAPGDVAWRLSLLTLDTSGRFDNPTPTLVPSKVKTACSILHEEFTRAGLVFHAGEGFRHLCVEKEGATRSMQRSGPQDIIGLAPGAVRDATGTAALDAALVTSNARLAEIRLGVWAWSGGILPVMPPFSHRYGHSAALVGAVPLARGLALALGMEAPAIRGATGDQHTDLAAKVEAAVTLAARHPVVFVHVESPDLLAHARNHNAKRRELTRIDAQLVGPLHTALPHSTLLITCDHATDCRTGAHLAIPVPFLLHTPQGAAQVAAPATSHNMLPDTGYTASNAFNEQSVAQGLRIASGPSLLQLALHLAGLAKPA